MDLLVVFSGLSETFSVLQSIFCMVVGPDSQKNFQVPYGSFAYLYVLKVDLAVFTYNACQKYLEHP